MYQSPPCCETLETLLTLVCEFLPRLNVQNEGHKTSGSTCNCDSTGCLDVLLASDHQPLMGTMSGTFSHPNSATETHSGPKIPTLRPVYASTWWPIERASTRIITGSHTNTIRWKEPSYLVEQAPFLLGGFLSHGVSSRQPLQPHMYNVLISCRLDGRVTFSNHCEQLWRI